MFGSRRHRPPRQPLTAATANPHAATAAVSAFARQSSSHSQPSAAAAAAAALKARPHTPTNVAEVQTKRTVRRSVSVSSAGSHNSGPGLKRSPSAVSMSERSLRSSSPRRLPVHDTAEEPPPVPSIPDHAMPKSNGGTRYGFKRRAVSLHVQPLKLGSEVMKEGHTSWFGPPTLDPEARPRTADSALQYSDARPTSPGSSINFSYPRAARAASPVADNPPVRRHAPTRPSTAGSSQELVYDLNSRRMVPRSEIIALEQSMKEPPRKPTRRRKKKRTPAPSSDSGAGAVSSVSSPDRAVVGREKQDESQAPFEAPELVTGRMYEDMGAEIFVAPGVGPHEDQRLGSGPEINPPAILDRHHERAGATPFPARAVSAQPRYEAYRPPTAPVHEIAGGTESHRHASSAQDTPQVRGSIHTGNLQLAELPADHFRKTSLEEPSSGPGAEPGKAVAQDPKGAPVGSHKTVSIARKERLAAPVLHSPPPRSTSPIKSALKQPAGSDQGSEASADVTHHLIDPATARKKAIRVSFDDGSTVVREAASDNSTSLGVRPATKKRWFNLSRRRGSGSSAGDGEDGEVMKPRPMLPSFGSVREKKAKSHEERPLVRPSASTHLPPRSTPLAVLPTILSDPDLGEHNEGFSSDHAIGTALTDDLAHRDEENMPSSHEPLPPQVTSVEGDGFWSDESSGDSPSFNDEERREPLAESGGDEADATGASTALGRDATRAEAGAINNSEEGDGGAINTGSKPESSTEPRVPSVPRISVSDPSPLPEEEVDMPDSPQSSGSDQFFDVSNSFPVSDGADKGVPGSDASESQATETLPDATASQPSRSGPYHQIPATIKEESEESGVFSDAYEDLSDVDGDGFQFLDAIATRPTGSGASPVASSKAVATVAEEIEEVQVTTLGPAQVDGARDMDWEHAKAYWRSLSAEKRRQLEQEAMQDAGEEADLDESKPAAKPKKKKSGKMTQGSLGEDRASPTGVQATAVNGRQPRRLLHKTLRDSRPASSDGAAVAQSQSERQQVPKSLVSPLPTGSSGDASEGGMRKSLRKQRSSDAVATEGPHQKEKRHSLQFPMPSLSLPQKRKGRSNRRAVSLEANHDSDVFDWAGSRPRRGSFSSESSFTRATPRPETNGFRKTLRSNHDSPGMVPGSSSGKMGSFSLRSSSPPRGPFRRRSLGSSPSASPGSRVRASLRPESSEESPRHRRIFSLGMFSRKGKQRSIDRDDSSDEDVFAEPPDHQAAAAHESTLSEAKPAPEPAREESEELPDSDSDPNHRPVAAPPKQTALGTSLLSNESIRSSRPSRGSHSEPERKDKGGLMSALRRRKGNQGRIVRPERMESAARRDTRLERTTAELEALRADDEDDDDDDDDDGAGSIEVPRKRLAKRGPGRASEGKRRFSALRRVLKMDG